MGLILKCFASEQSDPCTSLIREGRLVLPTEDANPRALHGNCCGFLAEVVLMPEHTPKE